MSECEKPIQLFIKVSRDSRRKHFPSFSRLHLDDPNYVWHSVLSDFHVFPLNLAMTEISFSKKRLSTASDSQNQSGRIPEISAHWAKKEIFQKPHITEDTRSALKGHFKNINPQIAQRSLPSLYISCYNRFRVDDIFHQYERITQKIDG